MNNAFRSHKLFFEILTRRRLNELLHRASDETNYLQEQINDRLRSLGS
jgi:hypothetical protein